MGKKLFEEEQEVQDAMQHREMSSKWLGHEMQNKDADDVKTSELMIAKSLEFECCKELIKGLIGIIELDQVNIYKAHLNISVKQHKLMHEAKKFIS